jgi:hypothetical protein
MKTIKVSMQGTLDETIKYCLLAMWLGWRLKSVKRIPHPTEYTLEMTPPNKASTRQGRA